MRSVRGWLANREPVLGNSSGPGEPGTKELVAGMLAGVRPW